MTVSRGLAGRALAALVLLMVTLAVQAGGTGDAIAQDEDPFYRQVVDRARQAAARDYEPPETSLPDGIADLSYDAYRSLRFRPEQALWRGERNFEVQFFHLGFLYREPVRMHIIEDGESRPLPFDPAMFDYSQLDLDEEPSAGLGFAGFRIHYPLNTPTYKDEVAVFLGASYFRLVAREQVYGISARGLAVDTALAKGEEFPVFREFWLVKPAPDATTMTIYALLDSDSVTGAYRFELRPGTETVVDVTATVFARADVERLGIAPLTSMYLFSETGNQRFDDYRPEVHDSDGLLAHTGSGEWIWRPLVNPPSLRVTTLLDENPRGFGLLQRDRDFSNYLDLEARFERRPSLWVEPAGDGWGRGAVHLVEIPTNSEINDNIVAFWVPEQQLKKGDSRQFRYRLRSLSASVIDNRSLGHVRRTRIGWAHVPGSPDQPPRSHRRFIVDFAGGDLPSIRSSQPVDAEVETSSGEISDVVVQRLPDDEGWRASFRLAPDGGTPSDMRMFLRLRGERLTETWNYIWSANDTE